MRSSSGSLYAQAFCLLWAVGHVAHALRKEPFNDSFSWLYVLACVLLIHRPRSPGRLALLCLAQLAMFADRVPVVDNHMYIMAFVNAGLLVAALPLAVRRRLWTGEAFGVARTYAVVVFLMSYAAAAVAKLNRDFLFSDASCSLTMLDDAASVLGLDRTVLPASMTGAVPFLVAGVELAVPLLLTITATRSLGIILAVLFHLAISLSPTATAIDFTVMIFAVLFLLLPRGPALDGALEVGRRAAVRARDRLDGGTAGILLLFAIMVAHQWRLGTVAGNRGWVLVASTALLLGAVLVGAVIRGRGVSDPSRLSLRRLHPVHYLLLALALLNIAAPYLGLKTAGTYTMYSNLDTYQNESNHYLLPRLNRGSFHDDLVEILDTSNERLREVQEDSLLITWHELQRTLAEDPEARIAYRRGGQRFAYGRAADNPELVTLDLVLHKLLAHRVQPTGPGRCLW